MSPHLICLSWLSNFHIISRPDPEAGHKRDLRCQLRHIKWGLISKLSSRPFLSHHPEPLRGFFHFVSPCRAVPQFPCKSVKVMKNQWKNPSFVIRFKVFVSYFAQGSGFLSLNFSKLFRVLSYSGYSYSGYWVYYLVMYFKHSICLFNIISSQGVI